MGLRLWRKYGFEPGDRVVTWSRILDGYHGTIVRKSRPPWAWVVEFDSDRVPGGKQQTVGQAALIPEGLAPPGNSIDEWLGFRRRKRR